jgi:hypothetical protein
MTAKPNNDGSPGGSRGRNRRSRGRGGSGGDSGGGKNSAADNGPRNNAGNKGGGNQGGGNKGGGKGGKRRSQQNNRRGRNRRSNQPQDTTSFWGEASQLPDPKTDVRITDDPDAVPRSLGTPPLPGQEAIAGHYFAAVYDRAVATAGALAAAGGLIDPNALTED